MTTTKTKPITKAQVRDELRRIKAEMPDTVNPVDDDGMSCVYHKGRGRNISRCMIGQLGWNFGLPTPDAYASNAKSLVVDHDGPWEGRFTEAAAQYMFDVQIQADSGGLGGDPLPWGKVKV
jgi:hypothetical protein